MSDLDAFVSVKAAAQGLAVNSDDLLMDVSWLELTQAMKQAATFGSLAMMTGVLVSPDSYFEYEAAHGIVQQHCHKHLRGGATTHVLETNRALHRNLGRRADWFDGESGSGDIHS